jgi:hypothetical protein
MRAGLAALCVAALAFAACAAIPAPSASLWPADTAHVVRLVVHPEAAAQLESLAAVTRATRREQAGCVTSFAALPIARGGWIIAIIAIDHGAVPFVSDSLSVRWVGQLCAPGVPNVHSHIVPNEVWGRPSDYDTLQVRVGAERAPFHVLVSVSAMRSVASRIVVYGIR